MTRQQKGRQAAQGYEKQGKPAAADKGSRAEATSAARARDPAHRQGARGRPKTGSQRKKHADREEWAEEAGPTEGEQPSGSEGEGEF